MTEREAQVNGAKRVVKLPHHSRRERQRRMKQLERQRAKQNDRA